MVALVLSIIGLCTSQTAEAQTPATRVMRPTASVAGVQARMVREG
jgi:hypothetical protein